MSRIGHNSVSGIAADRLASFVGRIEGLETEIKALNADKKDVYAEAKGTGFDVATIKRVVRARRMDPLDRDEQDALFDLYMRSIDMVPALPAGAHARSNKHATPHDPKTGEIYETDEHPAGREPLDTQEPDDAERRLVTEAPLESGAGAAESPSEGGRPVNSETEAPPAHGAAGEGAGVEPAAAALPAPSTLDDDDWVVDKVSGERRPWCPDRDMPDCLRRSA